MIDFFTGNNLYQLDQALKQAVAESDEVVERYDGELMTQAQLVDLVMGETLFLNNRIIVIKNLSDNKSLWSDAVSWFEKVSKDTQLILIEPNVDKRSKAYKWLQKNADVKIYDQIVDKDKSSVIKWMQQLVIDNNKQLTVAQAEHIIKRVGYNQQQLANALDKVCLLDDVTVEAIDDVVEASPQENVFQLLATAFSGDIRKVQRTISELEKTENSYKVFGLIVSQLQQYALLKYGNNSVSQIARDTGMNEYGLRRQASVASQVTESHLQHAVEVVANADMRVKTGDSEPWRVLEYALVSIASYKNL